jgi:ABC-type ATPase involved in cell division
MENNRRIGYHGVRRTDKNQEGFTMLQGIDLTLTYRDGDKTLDAVHGVSLRIKDHQFIAPVQDKAHAGQATALLADLGLGDKLHRFPHELSGGERQRVAIARAMIHRPRIIFADEPTGLLDRRTGSQVTALLRSYRDQGSLIAVTHNPEILTEADLILRMCDGQRVDIEDRVAGKT